MNPKALEMHKERVNKVFANQPEEMRAKQVHDIVIKIYLTKQWTI